MTHCNTSWNTPYTFSGKEKDVETGYGYFGARYYDSGLSIWLSVDPMSDKYPSMSPYNYCANNPVIYFDPDGRWIPGLDDKNNIILTAEKGDNLESFKKFMGPDHNELDLECAYNQMQNGQINLTETIGGTFQLMTDAFNDAKGTMPLILFAKGTDQKNYNCTGAAIALNEGKKLDNHAMMSDLGFFDKVIGWDYQSVSLKMQQQVKQ